MKKRIAFVLLCSLLLLSLSGCVLPNSQNEGTTPETTTPEVTTPTSEVSTPASEQNLLVGLFGDETVEFEAPVFAMNASLSDASPLRFKVENGKVHLLGIGNTYTISSAKNLSFTYPDNDNLWWGIEKDEKALQTYDKIKNSADFFILEAEGEVAGYQKIELCIIDDVYYFLTHNSNHSKVLKIHHATIG